MLRSRVIIADGAEAAPGASVPTPPDRAESHNAAAISSGILLSIDKIPAWYGENPYIRSGYRPVLSAVAPCFRSWAYVHNQSANIFTHLVPGVLALVANAALVWCFSAWYPAATLADRLVLHVYLTACALCFGVSAAYHTLLCHSRELADLWVRLDYVSISVLILASFVPGLYMGFYCEPLLLRGYLTVVVSMGALNAYLSMNDRYGSKDWLTSRLLPFLGLGFSAFIPIIHAALIFPYDQLRRQSGLDYYYLEGVLMVAGVSFLATRFPERWLPGTFDYWGASHEIFHCFVVMGALSHLTGIMSGYDWNYNNQRCGLGS
ncbi:Adiponectin receptor protein [Tolypocladium ophioglossoides CBS 100239]|uniref:Adiponectin receptor protein n=1 Tax=Tolypocladium ophioglossoides (strain CBS 100239) TaxID=1163406 RepID=A0A0L0NLT5_TOLOC|nr:Adiponectin receptor protein [Tolypocladium ophioglossoides CBS 100239]